MRTFLMLPVVAALLCGCGDDFKPIALTVPTDPSVLHGHYLGIMEGDRNGQYFKTAVELNSTATYVSNTQYRASGTLDVEGKTYTFEGLGVGTYGATFKPQTSPLYPSVEFDADLFLNGEKVGILTEDRTAHNITTRPPTQHYLSVQLGVFDEHHSIVEQQYRLDIDRK